MQCNGGMTRASAGAKVKQTQCFDACYQTEKAQYTRNGKGQECSDPAGKPLEALFLLKNPCKCDQIWSHKKQMDFNVLSRYGL
jgi:hypothetical protein